VKGIGGGRGGAPGVLFGCQGVVGAWGGGGGGGGGDRLCLCWKAPSPQPVCGGSLNFFLGNGSVSGF